MDPLKELFHGIFDNHVWGGVPQRCELPGTSDDAPENHLLECVNCGLKRHCAAEPGCHHFYTFEGELGLPGVCTDNSLPEGYEVRKLKFCPRYGRLYRNGECQCKDDRCHPTCEPKIIKCVVRKDRPADPGA